MTRHTLNTLAALVIAALLSTSYLLDGPDDIATAQTVANDLHQAQRDAQANATKSVAATAHSMRATGTFGTQMASAKAAQP